MTLKFNTRLTFNTRLLQRLAAAQLAHRRVTDCCAATARGFLRCTACNARHLDWNAGLQLPLLAAPWLTLPTACWYLLDTMLNMNAFTGGSCRH